MVVDDTEVEHRRLFVKAKNNLAPDKKALSYMTGVRLIGHDEETGKEIWAPHIIWGEEHVEITANEAMQAEAGGGKRSKTELREGQEFLSTQLAQGPKKKDDILDEAKGNDISDRTLRRAKEKLQIESFKPKGAADAKWMWKLPEAKKSFSEPERSDR